MKLICLLFHASFLTRIVIGSLYTRGRSDAMNMTSHRVYQTGEGSEGAMIVLGSLGIRLLKDLCVNFFLYVSI